MECREPGVGWLGCREAEPWWREASGARWDGWVVRRLSREPWRVCICCYVDASVGFGVDVKVGDGARVVMVWFVCVGRAVGGLEVEEQKVTGRERNGEMIGSMFLLVQSTSQESVGRAPRRASKRVFLCLFFSSSFFPLPSRVCLSVSPLGLYSKCRCNKSKRKSSAGAGSGGSGYGVVVGDWADRLADKGGACKESWQRCVLVRLEREDG
ncbi:hypothetical protein LX32DRAFT_1621 [Colletotrichum zoysiae]|uniref:Uncharacterized protein n=1 Tax=Colletotrichum zoysiae TaxID=1216348 RepID=A0AAD9M815_9PEZI|nr:hypothetical protein LX32DRAFT_1621 [Colletotrichum zoysiae]